MRIAYVISTLERSGPVNVLFGIVENLLGQCEMAVYTLAPECENSRQDEFEALGVSVTCVCRNRVESMLWGKKTLAKALDNFRPDIVHAHSYRAYILCAGLAYPTIATKHNCIYEDFKTSYSKPQALWMARTEVAALKRFDLVAACSESNAECLRNEYGLDVVAVRNGVDQSVYFAVDDAARAELRTRLGYGAGKTILISTGGCSEWKGTLPLIEGFHAANEAEGTAELHIFGKGPEFERCVELGYGDVVLHGFVDNVVPYLQAADLFVSASLSEGMPLAVLEAISCGLPALLSDIPPHREIVNAIADQGSVDFFELENNEIKEAFSTLCNEAQIELRRSVDTTIFSSLTMALIYRDRYCDVLQEEQR